MLAGAELGKLPPQSVGKRPRDPSKLKALPREFVGYSLRNPAGPKTRVYFTHRFRTEGSPYICPGAERCGRSNPAAGTRDDPHLDPRPPRPTRPPRVPSPPHGQINSKPGSESRPDRKPAPSFFDRLRMRRSVAIAHRASSLPVDATCQDADQGTTVSAERVSRALRPDPHRRGPCKASHPSR